MSSIKAIEDLINGYATSEDSSFLIPNVTEDFLAVRPSGNPITAYIHFCLLYTSPSPRDRG